LDTPVDSEGLVPEVDDKVVEPTTSAEVDKGVAKLEPMPARAEVEEKEVTAPLVEVEAAPTPNAEIVGSNGVSRLD
jgi:hypothetical protein